MTLIELKNMFNISSLEINSNSLSLGELKLPLANFVLLFAIILIIKSLNSEAGIKYSKILCFSSAITILLQILTIVYSAILSCISYMESSMSIIYGMILYVGGMGIDISKLIIADNLKIPVITTIYTNLCLNIFKLGSTVGICSCILGISGNGMSNLTNGVCKIFAWGFSTITSILVAIINTSSKIVGAYGNVAIKSAQVSMGSISPTNGKELGEMSGLIFDSLNAIATTAGNMVLCSTLAIIVTPLVKALFLLLELKILGSITDNILGTNIVSNAITSGTIALSFLLSISICTIFSCSSLCGVIERLSL